MYMDKYECRSLPQLHKVMNDLCVKHNGKQLPFPSFLMKELKQLGIEGIAMEYLNSLDIQEDAEKEVNNLKDLAFKNPPKVGYKDPDQVPIMKEAGSHTIHKICRTGVDLPGWDEYHPMMFTKPYYTDYFYAMYQGNYDDFMAIMNGLSEEELKNHLNQREGLFQAGPVSVPILGTKIYGIHENYDGMAAMMMRVAFPKIQGKYYEIVEKLLELGADPNAKDMAGKTAIYHAMNIDLDYEHKEKLIELLIHHGGDVNAVDRLGSPLIAYAVERQCVRMVKLLMKHGSDPSVKAANYFPKMSVVEFAKLRSSEEPDERAIMAALTRRGEKPTGCQVCHKTEVTLKKCAACGSAWYCSSNCQKQDWGKHKSTCSKKQKKKTK